VFFSRVIRAEHACHSTLCVLRAAVGDFSFGNDNDSAVRARAEGEVKACQARTENQIISVQDAGNLPLPGKNHLSSTEKERASPAQKRGYVTI
jgi:hypothetical protein